MVLNRTILTLGLVAGCGYSNSTSVDAPAHGGPDVAVTTLDARLVDGAPDAIPADAAEPSLPSVPGVVLWLDAGRGVTLATAPDGAIYVGSWADGSGHANNARSTYTVISPTASTEAAFGHRTAFHFTTNELGTASFVLSGAPGGSLDLGTDDVYIAVVARFASGATSRSTFFTYAMAGLSDGLILRGNGLNGAFNTTGVSLLGAPLSQQTGEWATNLNVVAAYNDGAARVYATQRVAGVSTLRVNGTTVGTQTAATNADLSGEPVIVLGVDHISTDPLAGDLAEVVVIRGTLSDSDRALVESYLHGKYVP